MKISYVIFVSIDFPVKRSKRTHFWTLCDVFLVIRPSRSTELLFNAFSLYANVLHSIGYGWSMCTTTIDNKSWVGFTLTPTLRLSSAGNSSHLLQWNTGNEYNCHFFFLLYRHCFTVFIFSLAITVKRRTASLSLWNTNFQFLRNHFSLLPCYFDSKGNSRNSTEFDWKNTCVSHRFFFSHTFQTRQIFFFLPLFDSFCDKLSCDVDVRSFFVFGSSFFPMDFFSYIRFS